MLALLVSPAVYVYCYYAVLTHKISTKSPCVLATLQMIDSLVVQVHESISELESLGLSGCDDIERAQSYIKDANLSAQVCSCLGSAWNCF